MTEQLDKASQPVSLDYHPLRKWEWRTGELSTVQKREARACLWGLLRVRVCYVCRNSLDARLLHLAYDIHHLLPRGSPSSNFIPNLRLAHHGCNAREGVPTESVRVDRPHAPRPLERDGFSAIKNAEAEPEFRRFVFAWIKQNKEDPPTPDFLIDNGAALVGANPVTVERWLRKMLATLYGCLDGTQTNRAGQRVVVLRDAEDYETSVEELERKYPWDGMRFVR